MASIQNLAEAINLIREARTYIIDHDYRHCNCQRCQWLWKTIEFERRNHEYRQGARNQEQTETQTESKTNRGTQLAR